MKKTLALLLSLALLAALFLASSLPVSAADTPASAFEFDAEAGTITGLTDKGKNLTELVIPAKINGVSVRRIDDYAFDGCTSLTSVTIGNSVTTIGEGTFIDCTSLTAINVAPANTAYTSQNGVLFTKDMKILHTYPAGKRSTAYVIPDSVREIGWGAFADCKSLTSVTIPNSVKIIGSCAFMCCTFLTSMTIPDSVREIGGAAFGGCASLPAINVATVNTAYTSQDEVLFTKDIKTLHTYPAGKPGTTYVIPDSVTEIGDWAFSWCMSLTGVTIPDSVTEIDDYAFLGCTSLTSVTIPDSVTEIGDDAFEDCTSLTNVYYTGTEEQWKAIEPLLNANIHYNYVPPAAEKGDANGDGVVDNLDAALVLRYDAGIVGRADIENFSFADITGDGEVDNLDAAMILRYDAGLIEGF